MTLMEGNADGHRFITMSRFSHFALRNREKQRLGKSKFFRPSIGKISWPSSITPCSSSLCRVLHTVHTVHPVLHVRADDQFERVLPAGHLHRCQRHRLRPDHPGRFSSRRLMVQRSEFLFQKEVILSAPGRAAPLFISSMQIHIERFLVLLCVSSL